jgi:hypothetical protein
LFVVVKGKCFVGPESPIVHHSFMTDLPTADIEDWEFNQGFYCGLSQEAKENIDALAGGTFFMLNAKKT